MPTIERVGGYRVVRRIATGGTSDVLLAKAEGPHGFERTVVLKLLLSQLRADDELARMFAREAAAYARLSHPSIVRLYDFFAQPASGAGPGTPNDGQLVMVLEHVDGPPLSRLRSMLKTVGKELDDRTAIYIAGRIFAALSAAHAATDESGAPAPVIHRDVNPSNVLVAWDGQVKLADFGVAKVTGSTHQSAAGLIRGTYGYMAPEQVTGEGGITPRADVYACAIILWELLTRRRAFQRGALPEVEALRAMAEPHLPSIDTLRSDVDKTIRDALKRALEPRADKRAITAGEMVGVLTLVVPSDEGRDRLVAAMEAVRYDPRATAVEANADGGFSDRPPALGGRSAPPRRPAVSVPAVGMSRPQSVPRQVAVRPNPSHLSTSTLKGIAPDAPAGVTSPPPVPAGGPLRRPSAAQRLAAAVPGERPVTRELESSPNLGARVGILDVVAPPSGVDPSQPVDVIIAASSPVVSDPGGAIEALLAASEAAPITVAMQPPPTPRGLGNFPPPPPIVATHSSAPPGADPTQAPTVAAPPLAATTVPGALQPASGKTSKMAALQQTVAMEERPATPAALQPPFERTHEGDPAASLPVLFSPVPPPFPPGQTGTIGDRPVYTGASLSHAFPPNAKVPADAPWPPADPVQHVPSGNPYAGDGASLSPPPKGGSRAGLLAGISVAALAVIVGGTVGYFRLVKQQPVATGPTATTAAPSVPPSGAPTLPVPVGSASAVTEPTPPASAEPPAPTVSAPTAESAAPTVAPTASAAPTTSAAPIASAAPTTSAAPAESATPTVASVPEGMGALKTAGTVPGRRIFVDGQVVGQTPTTVNVKCGQRTVKLGSSGKGQSVDVPCGGEITVGDK